MKSKNTPPSSLAELNSSPAAVKELGFGSSGADTFFNVVTWRQCTYTLNEIMSLAYEYLEDAMFNKDTLKPREFWKRKGLSPDSVERWRNKFPQFAEIYNTGADAIGDRLSRGAIVLKNRKYDPAFVMKYMRHYDPTWKKEENEKILLGDQGDKPLQHKQAVLRNWGAEVAKHNQLVEESDENDHAAADGSDRGPQVGDENTSAKI